MNGIPTHAVVSLLDDEHARRVRAIWLHLRERFGLRGVARTPHPHVSYVVAESAHAAAIAEGLQVIASSSATFSVQATGLGIFPGDEPVIYLPVVRAPAIDALHAAIEAMHDNGRGDVVARYRRDLWLPHITLARGGVDSEILGAAVDDLARTPIDWSIAIDNLTLIDGGDDSVSPRLQRFELNPRR